MPAILPLLALELLFLLLAFSFDAALGKHVACSWRVGEGSPRQYNYVGFCSASSSNGDFNCDQSIFPEKNGAKVATWGQLGRNVFEWRELSLPSAWRACSCSPPANYPSFQSVLAVTAEATV